MPQSPALDETLNSAQRTRVHRHRATDGSIQFQRTFLPNGSQTPGPEHHDILLVPPDGVAEDDQFFRMPVEKPTSFDRRGPDGHYVAPPELLDAHDYAQRSVLSVSDPAAWGPPAFADLERGPAFATLPVKPEPAVAFVGICYLVNTNNLNFRNAWTAEEWIDLPGGVNLPPTPGTNATSFEALLAGPRGKVFRVHIDAVDKWTPGSRAVASGDSDPASKCTVQCVDLREQSEIWSQLRNGAVIGRVLYRDEADGARVVPLVNITTLTPRESKDGRPSYIQSKGEIR